ncbi:MAG: DUF7065 domain-containing protein [Acidimicrobiia bacterium]
MTDLSALAAGRTYPHFGPADDDFHDEVMSDRWWETETQWFSWHVPERNLFGWTYNQARPNANLCNGGVWVWDDSSPYSWELPYHVNYSGLQLPPRRERDMRDFAWPTGVHVRTVEPLTTYEIAYVDEGALEVELVFDAIMPPNPHPTGVPPFLKGVHFDQAGHVTGHVVLHGERINVDCYAHRDRSWGPRPLGRPRKRPPEQAEIQTGTGGVGYTYGTASATNSFLVYTMPSAEADPVGCGYLLREGRYAHMLTGERVVDVDPVHGWPVHIVVDAEDDAGRSLHAEAEALTRHWRGHGGDTFLRWSWDGGGAYGEDQTYLSKATWHARRERARLTAS